LSKEGILVVSLQTHLSGGSDVSSVSAFGVWARRELWRVRLADFDRPAASDCFLLPSGVLLAIPNSSNKTAGLILLDPQTGAKKWERSSDDLRLLGVDVDPRLRLVHVGDGNGSAPASNRLAVKRIAIRQAEFFRHSGITAWPVIEAE
jgi:hypothetical protein